MAAQQRLISRLTDELGHSPVVANVVFSFLMAGVEKIVEVEFACPCDPRWSDVFAAAFFVIPAIIAFLLMLMIHNCKCTKMFPGYYYSFIPPLVWEVLVFLDGQYFVCATTDWEGTFVSVDKSYLKWCTPTNTTRSEDLMARSHKQYILSQGIGIGLLILLSLVLFLHVLMNCRENQGGRLEKQEQAPEMIQLAELSDIR